MPTQSTEQLPWYHEPPFDDTRELWKLWLLTRSEKDLYSLRSSFQSWSELWYFFATHREGFVKNIPHDMVELYREGIERINQRRRDASPYTSDDAQRDRADDVSPSQTLRGRASGTRGSLADRSPKSILTRTRSQSPAKHVSFNSDNLEQYEPVRKFRSSGRRESDKVEKKKPWDPQRHAEKQRMLVFIPSQLRNLFSRSAPPPPDDEHDRKEERAYLEAASALTATRLASLGEHKFDRGRKTLQPLLDDDEWSLSVGPRSPLKTSRSDAPASPRTAAVASRRTSMSPARGSAKKMARTRPASPAKKSLGKRTSSRSRSTSPGSEPARKRVTARSASSRKALSLDNEQLPTPSSSPERKLLLTPRTRRRSNARGLTRAQKSAATKTSSPVKAKPSDKVKHNPDGAATDHVAEIRIRSLEMDGTNEHQGQPERANPPTHDRRGFAHPYDAFSQYNRLYDIDKHDPDYLSLLGLDETQPNVSPYDADFHFASELHVPLDIDHSNFDVNSINTLPRQDHEVRILNRLVLLRDTIKRFALCYFGYSETQDETVSSWREMVRCRMAVRELVKYVEYVGDCGDRGEEGWDELLSKPDLRVALVCGIIWKIVKERVLDSLLFGATAAQTKALAAQEKSMVKSDGFARTAARANQINTWYPWSSKSGPPLLAQCATRLALQLQSLLVRLDPHWHMETGSPSKSVYRHSTHNYADAKNLASDPFFRELHRIVFTAAALNHSIRVQSDVIFYWVPVHKGMEFELERMTCANLWPVQRCSPFNDSEADVDPDVKALVRVVCFHGLTSYRRGGGDQARYMLERENREDYFEPGGQGDMDRIRSPREGEDVDVESGFRSRVLAKAIVALSWGVERPNETAVLNGTEKEFIGEGAQKEDSRYLDLMKICNDERIKEASRDTEMASE